MKKKVKPLSSDAKAAKQRWLGKQQKKSKACLTRAMKWLRSNGIEAAIEESAKKSRRIPSADVVLERAESRGTSLLITLRVSLDELDKDLNGEVW